MAEPPSSSDAYDDANLDPSAERPPSTPRWVKVSGAIAFVLIVLVVIVLLVGGDHGPGRHSSSGDMGGQTMSSSVAGTGDAAGREQPAGGHAR